MRQPTRRHRLSQARQTPEAKLALVRALQPRVAVVPMVGDGINDAPVLAGADVSIAMADGAALAQRAADLVMTGPALARIPAAIALARRTRGVVRQNLALGGRLQPARAAPGRGWTGDAVARGARHGRRPRWR